jgi:voltage-gated potassium channel
MHSRNETEQDVRAYDLFIAALAIAAVILISFRLFLPEDSETGHLIDYIDIGICAVFLFDFGRSMVIAENRWRYFYTWGWFDLLSSIPAISAFRYFRIARLLRLVRLVRSMRILVQVAKRDRPAALLSGLFLIGILAFIAICIGVLNIEQDAPGSKLQSAEDVLWWAVVTSSTVGYGDGYPVTNAGRLLASFLMVIGIGAFATTTTALGVVFKRLQQRSDQRATTPTNERKMESIDARLGRIEDLLQKDRSDDPVE